MPPRPTFDYYQTLGVLSHASPSEITNCYRRLALQHHPDKNPDNLTEATERFQKISEAYECLKDPVKRSEYDARNRRASSFPSGAGPRYSSPDDDNDFDFSDFFNFVPPFASAYRSAPRGNNHGYGYGYGAGLSPEEVDRINREAQAAEARRQKLAREANRKMREAHEAYVKAAAEKAKLEKEEREKKVKAELDKNELDAIKKAWEENNAVTMDERQAFCTHSRCWPKETFKRKTKCASCDQKRGFVIFTCPHCHLMACQHCLTTKYKKKNAKP